MANTFLTISMITREALRVLENNLVFASKVRRNYDDKYAVEGAKIGTTLNVRKPVRYLGRSGQALQIENATESQVPVVLDTQFGVDIEFTSQDLALSVDDFSDRFVKPAVATIGNKIDNDGLALYKSVFHRVGTPATVPSALSTYLNAFVKLDNSAAPRDGQRTIIMTPQMQADIVDALKGLFQQATAIAEQYRTGMMGRAIGADWFMDQNVNAHTVGALGGTPLVVGAGQSGASINTDGWTASVTGVLKRGDVITFASVDQVNPQSRQSVGALQDFVVTADVNSDGTGLATIPIDPPITTSGALQTVTASPADNAVILIFGSATASASKVSPTGMGFHADAFTLVTADLPVPRGTDMAARVSDKQLGISLRMIRDYDINTDKFPCRLDVLYGWKTLRPELAVRIQS